MDLRSVAAAFDNEVFDDAYSPGSSSFYGQTSVYDGSTRDGSTILRRVLSVDPDVLIPERLAVQTGDLTYLVGLSHIDYFKGEVVRSKRIIHRVTGLADITTVAQALAGTTGVKAYASRTWLKYDKSELEGSEKLPVYNLYFSDYETLAVGNLIELGGVYFRVRAFSYSAAGFKVVECYELDATPSEITYTPRTTVKDIASDSYLPQTPVLIQALVERYLSYYENPDVGFVKVEPGDIAVSILVSDITVPANGEQLTISGREYKVRDFRTVGSSHAIHARPL